MNNKTKIWKKYLGDLNLSTSYLPELHDITSQYRDLVWKVHPSRTAGDTKLYILVQNAYSFFKNDYSEIQQTYTSSIKNLFSRDFDHISITSDDLEKDQKFWGIVSDVLETLD